jgi:ABC-type Zn uptake system ZnuABC Zn-binding protein ZnuA
MSEKAIASFYNCLENTNKFSFYIYALEGTYNKEEELHEAPLGKLNIEKVRTINLDKKDLDYFFQKYRNEFIKIEEIKIKNIFIKAEIEQLTKQIEQLKNKLNNG